jgi:hypothetical protein
MESSLLEKVPKDRQAAFFRRIAGHRAATEKPANVPGANYENHDHNQPSERTAS